MAERLSCPNCGHSSSLYRFTCKECGHNLKDSFTQPATRTQEPTTEAEEKELSTLERSAILDKEVAYYIRRGFRVISRTDTTAQLVKPKSFSILWFFILMFTLIG